MDQIFAPPHPVVRFPRLQRAFSLIELLVVVGIVAILARFAIPAYWNYVLQGHRSDAKTALLDLAAREERYFTQYNSYSSVASALGYGTSATFPVALPGGTAKTDYNLSVSSVSATAYTLQATPVSPQTDDTSCYGYQLDNFGNQYNFLSVGGTASAVSGCW